jgi:hypothetical protein
MNYLQEVFWGLEKDCSGRNGKQGTKYSKMRLFVFARVVLVRM